MTVRRSVRVRVRHLLVGGLLAAGLALAGCGGEAAEPGDAESSGPAADAPDLVRVPQDAATIQAAVDTVAAGGLVLVDPGTYRESVTIRTEDVTLRGTSRDGVVIDGEGKRPHGVVGIADGVRVQNLTVTRNTFYGVLITGLHDENGARANNDDGYENFDPEKFPPLQRFRVDHVTASNNGLYGIYAFNSQHGVIAQNYASGSADSGFYVGQCRACDILVTGNVGERNAVGFENANASRPLLIAGNRFSDNRVGMTLLSDYQEVFIPETGDVVAGNAVVDNNEVETPAQAEGGFGIGIGLQGGTENDFRSNLIDGNVRAGVVLGNSSDLPALANTFSANAFGDNGVDFADISAGHTPSTGNCPQPGITTLPAALASRRCGPATEGLAVEATRLIGDTVAPEGISFLDVPAPPAQPSLRKVEAVPGPLPKTVTMPDPDSFTVPARSYLADLTLEGAR